MAALKKWFKRQQMDVKFKHAGSGHKLTEERSSQAQSASTAAQQNIPKGAGGRTEGQRRAAEAALNRVEASSQKPQSRSQQAIRAQVQRELELSEQQAQAKLAAMEVGKRGPEERDFEYAPVLAVQGVYFTCDLLPETGPHPVTELLDEIEVFLREQYEDEPLLSSATMIHSLNRVIEKRKVAVETLKKYVSNVLGNPEEEKYRKIRCGNKVFTEKIVPIKGGLEFLKAVGFEPTEIDEESYLFLPSDPDPAYLQLALDYLDSAQPIPVQLYRDPRVFSPSKTPSGTKMELPKDFYDPTAEELKREQMAKTEEAEKVTTLRTKQMRERDELKRIYRYKYTVLRIRFPDDYVLQGTFRSGETLDAVDSFIREHIALPELPFDIFDARGEKLSDHDGTNLAEMELTPAAILTFRWDQDVADSGICQFLSDESKALVESD